MPYASAKQRRFMHARHPGIARKWDEEIRSVKKGLPSYLRNLGPDDLVSHPYAKGRLYAHDRGKAASKLTTMNRKQEQGVKAEFRKPLRARSPLTAPLTITRDEVNRHYAMQGVRTSRARTAGVIAQGKAGRDISRAAIGKNMRLSEIRKATLPDQRRDDRKAIATGVGGVTTAAGLGGTGVFVVRAKGHKKMLANQIASEKLHAGTRTTQVNHYLRGEGAGKIAPEQHILRHLKRGRAASIGLAAGGGALTAYGLRKKKVEKADRDRRRSTDLALMGGGTATAGGAYGLTRGLESQGNKWAGRAAAKIEEAQKIAPQLGGWKEGKTRTKVRHVQPEISNKKVPENPKLLRGMSSKKIEEVASLRGAAGQHRHFGKIYGDIGRQFRRYAVPAGVAAGAAGAGDMAVRRRRERMSKAMTREEKRKSTATGVGAVGIGAGLLGGGIPGVKADSKAGSDLFPHLPKHKKPTPKDLLHPGPVIPRVKAAGRMGRGGIFGYRSDAHQSFLDRQLVDEAKNATAGQTTRGNHFLRGQGTGKVAPEQKIIRHMKTGRKASYGLLAGGAGLTAYGQHRKKAPVEKADRDSDRRNGALVAGGGTVAGSGYGAARLLEHQGRRWAKQSARDIEASQKIAPELGGWTEGSRKNKRVPNVKPDVSNRQAESRRRNIFHNRTRGQAEEAGRLRGNAAQGRYFSGVYGANATRIRRLAIPAGLAVSAAGAGGMAASKVKEKRAVGKAYRPTYFGASAPTERLSGENQRFRTEVQHQGAKGAAVALGGLSTAAVGARWAGHKRAPEAIKAGAALAHAKRVPKEVIADSSKKATRLHHWAAPRRGKLLAASAAAGAAGVGASTIARWKKDEITGISQDLGRASAGDRGHSSSKKVAKGAATAIVVEGAVQGSKRLATLSPQTRKRVLQGAVIGTAGTSGGAGTLWAMNRGRRGRREHQQLRAAGGLSGPVMKGEKVGFGKSYASEPLPFGKAHGGSERPAVRVPAGEHPQGRGLRLHRRQAQSDERTGPVRIQQDHGAEPCWWPDRQASSGRSGSARDEIRR